MSDKKTKPAFHRLVIDFEPALHAKLKEVADRNLRSVSKQAKQIILDYLKNQPKGS